MSSSFRLQKRREQGETWSFGDLHNHYIRNWGECHPDFTGIPIGHPQSEAKVCVRRKGNCGYDLSAPQAPEKPWLYNGYHKFKADLYDPSAGEPRVLNNPSRYSERRTKDEEYALLHDYWRAPIRYNGHGITPTFTPGHQTVEKYGRDYNIHGVPVKVESDPLAFAEFGFSHMKTPPPSHDVTQLHQRYPIWREERERLGRYGPEPWKGTHFNPEPKCETIPTLDRHAGVRKLS